MPTSKTWPGGATGASPTSYSIPAAGDLNWASLSAFLIALADGAQSTVFQKFAIRKATTTPVTVSSSTDCTVVTNLAIAGAVAVSLPAGASKQVFTILDGKGDATTNNITITPNGVETIAGAATLVLTSNREAVILSFNATDSNWEILSRSTGSGVGLINPMSAVGDMIYGGTAGVATRLASSTANKILQTNSTSGAPTWVSLVNANVDAAAAIDGTKISPVFGSQDLSVGSTAFFVDNTNKRAYIGAASTDPGAGVGTYLAIMGSAALGSSNQVSNVRYDSTASEGPFFNFARSKSGTLGTKTVVVSGDSLGGIVFRGIDVTTTGNFVMASSITSEVDGTVGSGQVPGRLIFKTATAAGTGTEAGRINKAQQWTLGLSSSFPGNLIYGVSDGTSQTTGVLGEVQESVQTSDYSVSTPTVSTYFDATNGSVSLTAGVWYIEAGGCILTSLTPGAGKLPVAQMAIRSGSSTVERISTNGLGAIIGAASAPDNILMPVYVNCVKSITSTTTYKISIKYENFNNAVTPGTMALKTASGSGYSDCYFIRAIRIR